MNQTIIQTKQAKRVLQVYHNCFVYRKDKKSFSDRKALTKWKNEIHSSSGYLKNGRLILSQSDDISDLHTCDLIILNDWNAEADQGGRGEDGHPARDLQPVQFATLKGRAHPFKIFQMKEGAVDIELHLVYDLFQIGQPQRENFKLCHLELNTPIEVKINGKLDHSLTSGRERTYKEHCYIFHLLGETQSFEMAREPFEGSIKSIPKPTKTVDLMKELY